jgi:phosphoribosylformylglycinamidine synthase
MVRTNTMTTNEPSDASIIRVKGSNKALVATTDCNSSYVYADPYVGTMIAVSEAARNIVCSGGEPVAITNCLNFGNPYNPEVYYQFVNAIKGMGEACRKFETPVTGGNVSFYNQSTIKDKTVPVYPTPTIGMLGIMENDSNKMTLNSKNVGDVLILIGESKEDLGQSEYLKQVHNISESPAPYFNLDVEFDIQRVISHVIKEKLVSSVHDVSEGGIFMCLMEKSFPNNLGFNINKEGTLRKDSWLFGECQSRAILSVGPKDSTKLTEYLKNNHVKFSVLGKVTDGSIAIDGEDYGNIENWKEIHMETLGHIIEKS